MTAVEEQSEPYDTSGTTWFQVARQMVAEGEQPGVCERLGWPEARWR